MRLSVIVILVHAAIALTGCECGSGLDPRCAVWCDKKDPNCSCKLCLPQEEKPEGCSLSKRLGAKK